MHIQAHAHTHLHTRTHTHTHTHIHMHTCTHTHPHIYAHTDTPTHTITCSPGSPSGGSTVSTYMDISSHRPMCHAACALIMAISRLQAAHTDTHTKHTTYHCFVKCVVATPFHACKPRTHTLTHTYTHVHTHTGTHTHTAHSSLSQSCVKRACSHYAFAQNTVHIWSWPALHIIQS